MLIFMNSNHTFINFDDPDDALRSIAITPERYRTVEMLGDTGSRLPNLHREFYEETGAFLARAEGYLLARKAELAEGYAI